MDIKVISEDCILVDGRKFFSEEHIKETESNSYTEGYNARKNAENSEWSVQEKRDFIG